MNDRWHFVFGVFFCFLLLTPEVRAQSEKERVAIGIIADESQRAETDFWLAPLKRELNALLGSKYQIRILEDKILGADWSARVAAKNYDRLMRDQNVDIVIGIGLLTSSVIAQERPYPKPVIALGILDPKLQGLPLPEKNRSNVPNLTYVLLSNRSLARELDVFFELFPHRKVGVVFHGEWLNFFIEDEAFLQNFLRDVMEKNRTSFALLPFADAGETLSLAVQQGVDAFYIGYLGPHEGAAKRAFIDSINARGLPSFGSSVRDVRQGVLAATAPEENLSRIIRRVSLHVEAILNGEEVARLPVHMSFEENLTLNMQTANAIGFSPTYTVLAKAELVDEFALEGVRAVDLRQVVREVMDANLGLKIQRGAVAAAHKDVTRSRTRLFPALSLNATGVQIDKNSARFGQRAERAVTGRAGVEQVIFSERALSDMAIKRYQLHSVEYGYEKLKLDAILDAAVAYFQVLRAKTGRKIQRDNVALTKRNLEIARQREAIGYSGRSDVYRWESRLTTANTNLLSAKNDVELAKIQLNQLLNRPIDEAFIARETALSDSLYLSYLGSVEKYIDTPKSLRIYTDFLIEEARLNAPEIRQIAANINALQRSLQSLKLARFVPTLALSAEWQHVVFRRGMGLEIAGVDPIDNPWNVSLNASLPLFRGGATRVDIQKARIEIDKLEDQRAQLMRVLELNVRATMLDVVVKSVNLESSQKSAELADKSLELVQSEYAQGRVSIVDLVDAQNAALNARLNALDSGYEFLTSLLKTERAVGKFSLLGTSEERDEFLDRFERYFLERTR